MKIALLGYGKMGKAIEQIALLRGHEITLRHSLETFQENWKEKLANSDVAIEFTSPDAAVDNILSCFESDIPVVVGSTGWYNHFSEVAKSCEENNQSLFHTTNFSIGVNLFFELNRYLAKIMRPFDGYHPSLEEIHHIHKKDSPSGTAISLAEGIIENNPTYKAWENHADPSPEKLSIISVREDEVPGTHSVRYTSDIDQIEIKHTAFNRKGFATGAVVAAEFLIGKKGIFNMADLLKIS